MHTIRLTALQLVICLVSVFICPTVRGQDTASQERPQDEHGKYVTIGEMKMYYEIHGEGKPLLLLHWYDGTGKHSWGPFIEKLSSKYKLIIPDLRGHGRSANPSDSITTKQCAADVKALLDHLEIDKFDAMGASLGGLTLLQIATQDRDRIASMVIVGCGPYLPESARASLRKEVDVLYTDEKYLRLLRSIHPGGDKQIKKLASNLRKFADDYDDFNFTVPILKRIKAKTLIVSGDNDDYYSTELQAKMHNSIPNSSLWIIPEGGHLPQMNMVDEFTQMTLRFLREK